MVGIPEPQPRGQPQPQPQPPPGRCRRLCPAHPPLPASVQHSSKLPPPRSWQVWECFGRLSFSGSSFPWRYGLIFCHSNPLPTSSGFGKFFLPFLFYRCIHNNFYFVHPNLDLLSKRPHRFLCFVLQGFPGGRSEGGSGMGQECRALVSLE